jgi:hypothetical protein
MPQRLRDASIQEGQIHQILMQRDPIDGRHLPHFVSEPFLEFRPASKFPEKVHEHEATRVCCRKDEVTDLNGNLIIR